MSKDLLGNLELNRIYQFDCVEGMKLLPENCVDVTITSPPYDDLRTYNGYSFNFENVAQELFRVTKDGGLVIWIVSDKTEKGSETGTSFKQALYFKEIGFNIHDTMIYQKNASYAHDPNKHAGKIATGTKGRTKNGELRKVKPVLIGDFQARSNIWEYNTGKAMTSDNIAYKHPAIFPEKLVEDHILTWSNEDDIVLDPFMGSGTTAKMAQINNRKYLGFEISKEYIEIANIRLESLEDI